MGGVECERQGEDVGEWSVRGRGRMWGEWSVRGRGDVGGSRV